MAYLIRKMFHWFGGRVSARTRHMPVYLDDRTLRDIGLSQIEYRFLHTSAAGGAHDADGADQAKHPIAHHSRGPNLAVTDRA